MRNDDIAIIGMSCRLPAAAGLREFYECLHRPRDEVFCESVEGFEKDWFARFDDNFFQIADQEAELMDPQQKLFLALSHWAFEDAMIRPDRVPSNTGVYVGASSYEYSLENLNAFPDTAYRITGSGNCFIANRVSYTFNLTGPSCTIDAACSSSLVALKHAFDALKLREVDLALIGGVHAKLSDHVEKSFAAAGHLSQAGCCKPFSKDADGYLRSEGGGALVLKRLRDAVADNDRIYAVVRSVATNHNGSSLTLTSPNQKGQLALYSRAYSAAGLNPSDVDYIEANANGMAIGDQLEIKALSQFFCDDKRQSELLVGVTKDRFGNLEAASGAIGLIKTALQLHFGQVPEQNISNPVARVGYNIKLSYTATDGERAGGRLNPITAGINCFGLGGSNAHGIIQEYQGPPKKKKLAHSVSQDNILCLSASSTETLRDLVRQCRNLIESGVSDIEAWSHCVTHRSRPLSYRVSFIFDNQQDLIAGLDSYCAGQPARNCESGNHRHEPMVQFDISDPLAFIAKHLEELATSPAIQRFWERVKGNLDMTSDTRYTQSLHAILATYGQGLYAHKALVLYKWFSTLVSASRFRKAHKNISEILDKIESENGGRPNITHGDVLDTLAMGEVCSARKNKAYVVHYPGDPRKETRSTIDLDQFATLNSIRASMFCNGLDALGDPLPVAHSGPTWLPCYPFFKNLSTTRGYQGE